MWQISYTFTFFCAISFVNLLSFPRDILKLICYDLPIYPGDLSTPKSKLQSVQTAAPESEDLERKEMRFAINKVGVPISQILYEIIWNHGMIYKILGLHLRQCYENRDIQTTHITITHI